MIDMMVCADFLQIHAVKQLEGVEPKLSISESINLQFGCKGYKQIDLIVNLNESYICVN